MKINKKIIILTLIFLMSLASNCFAESDTSNFAGKGDSSFKDGEAAEAMLNQPYGMDVDAKGDIIFADTYNNKIRKISEGKVTTIAGTSEANDLLGFPLGAFKDGEAGKAYFNKPRDLVITPEGDIYVSDTGNNAIRKIKSGSVTTFAGKNTLGNKDGKGSNALFNCPSGIDLDKDGNLYIADTMNNAIRKIDKNSNVTTLKFVSSDSKIDYSILNEPSDIQITSNGDMYIVDSGNQMIKKVVNGKIYPVAGTYLKVNELGYVDEGFLDSKTNASRFNFPKGICVLDNGIIFVADTWNHSIRIIKPDGTVKTMAGTVKAGDSIGTYSETAFNAPSALLYKDGYLYVSDMWNNSIKKLKINYGSSAFDLDTAYASANVDFSKASKSIVNVAVDGKLVDFEDVTTVNINGKTYFPVRLIAEKLGAKVDYDEAKKLAKITYKNKTTEYSMTADYIKVINGRSMIHIRTLASDMGFFVSWNSKYNTVVVTK